LADMKQKFQEQKVFIFTQLVQLLYQFPTTSNVTLCILNKNYFTVYNLGISKTLNVKGKCITELPRNFKF